MRVVILDPEGEIVMTGFRSPVTHQLSIPIPCASRTDSSPSPAVANAVEIEALGAPRTRSFGGAMSVCSRPPSLPSAMLYAAAGYPCMDSLSPPSMPILSTLRLQPQATSSRLSRLRRSTKSSVSLDFDQDHSPVPNPRSSLRESVYTKYVDFHPITDNTLHADLTGALPVVAGDGSKHALLFVMANYIHVELLKNRTEKLLSHSSLPRISPLTSCALTMKALIFWSLGATSASLASPSSMSHRSSIEPTKPSVPFRHSRTTSLLDLPPLTHPSKCSNGIAMSPKPSSQ